MVCGVVCRKSWENLIAVKVEGAVPVPVPGNKDPETGVVNFICTDFLPYILRILVSEYYTYCLGQVLGDRG